MSEALNQPSNGKRRRTYARFAGSRSRQMPASLTKWIMTSAR